MATRVVLIWAIFSIQLIGCLSKDCPEFRKDVQWNFGGKGLSGDSYPKSAQKCQQYCQDYYRWDQRSGVSSNPCVGWSFWAEPGPWASGTWCYIFGNTNAGEPPLESSASSAPGAVSGLKYDCDTGKQPTIAEMLLEGVASLNLNKTNWKSIMAEDTDIDQNGDVSDIELEHKFGSYMEELFKMLDHDSNNIVTEEELESIRIDLPGMNKIVDAAFESFPIKSYLLAADGNRDGVLDENDFYLPAKPFQGPLDGGEFDYPPPGYPGSGYKTSVRLTRSDSNAEGKVLGNNGYKTPVRLTRSNSNAEGKVLGNNGNGYAEITKNEGNVICKSLGFKGLEKVVSHGSHKDQPYWIRHLRRTEQKYVCNGTEEKLEDCSLKSCSYCQEMGVVCKEEIGSLRLVGGKDGSSGDIFLGNKGLGCRNWRNGGKEYEVICRELGFPGVLKTTRSSTFTRSLRPRPDLLSKMFKCQGNENKLADCSVESPSSGECYSNQQGIVCKKTDDGIKMAKDKFLEEITSWKYAWEDWEVMGRFLFIADGNNDGKLTSEEIIAKAKQYLETMFNFMDQNRDGFVSIKDFTSPHMTIGPIHQIIDRCFDKTEKDGEIDLMRPITPGGSGFFLVPWWLIVIQYIPLRYIGLDVMDLRGSYLDEYDWNNDTKLNADDLLDYLMTRKMDKSMYLIAALSKKLDKNQDGKLQRQEVRDFVDDIFKQLDIDGDGALTFEDAFGFMKENGVSCLSILEWRSFLPRFMKVIETQFGEMMKYFFKELDEDRNGKIDLKEFQHLHIPCATSRKEGDRHPSRIHCHRVMGNFFEDSDSFKKKVTVPSKPFSRGNRGGPGRSNDNEIAEITCKMLS